MVNASHNMRGPNATYVPPARVGLALGQWGIALGPRGFSDTNMLVFATQKSRIWGITQRKDPTWGGLRCSGVCIGHVDFTFVAHFPSHWVVKPNAIVGGIWSLASNMA